MASLLRVGGVRSLSVGGICRHLRLVSRKENLLKEKEEKYELLLKEKEEKYRLIEKMTGKLLQECDIRSTVLDTALLFSSLPTEVLFSSNLSLITVPGSVLLFSPLLHL